MMERCNRPMYSFSRINGFRVCIDCRKRYDDEDIWIQQGYSANKGRCDALITIHTDRKVDPIDYRRPTSPK